MQRTILSVRGSQLWRRKCLFSAPITDEKVFSSPLSQICLFLAPTSRRKWLFLAPKTDDLSIVGHLQQSLNVCFGPAGAIFSAKAPVETKIRETSLCRFVGQEPFPGLRDCGKYTFRRHVYLVRCGIELLSARRDPRKMSSLHANSRYSWLKWK